MLDPASLALAAAAGILGGAMNALAGGGTFATLPALIALGLPSTAANATSNMALMPGAAASAWEFRDELEPLGGLRPRSIAAITFIGGLVGSSLLVLTPSSAFDFIIPWLLLFGFVIMAFGRRASNWLRARFTIGRNTLITVQTLLGIYGGYFGGGVGLMATAAYGLLAGAHPRSLFAIRTMMLAVANLASACIFVFTGIIGWAHCIPMLLGAILGGWLGARLGKKIPATIIQIWTLIITAITTIIFFVRAYG